MGLLLGYFLLAIVVSFLCSIWEAVLLSVNPSYIKRKEMEGKSSGKLLSELKDDIDKPLSAILTLNTIAHTVGAIGVGAQAGKIYGTEQLSIFGWEISYESIIAALMTLGILYLSEIIPKTIGASYWQSLAPITARSIKGLMIMLKPFIWLSSRTTKLLKKNKDQSIFSKQDLAAMAKAVSETGQIKNDDYTLIKNVLKYDEIVASDIMTPRNVIVIADESEIIKDFYSKNKTKLVSRIPLYDTAPDMITGILLKDDLLEAIVENRGNNKLKEIKREVITVSNEEKIRDIFYKLNEKRQHLAVVKDDYGTLLGLVTLEDIIETVFGLEIMDETDSIADLQSYARQLWEDRAKKIGLIK